MDHKLCTCFSFYFVLRRDSLLAKHSSLTPVCTRQFEDIGDAYEEAIEFIMGDPQSNIYVIIGDHSSLFQCHPSLRCFKVPGNEPLDAFVSTSDLGNHPLAPLLALFTPMSEFKSGGAPIILQRESVLFSKTFFKQLRGEDPASNLK